MLEEDPTSVEGRKARLLDVISQQIMHLLDNPSIAAFATTALTAALALA